MSQAGTARQLEEDPVKARRAEGPGVAALQFCRGGAGSRKGQRAGRKDTGLRVHPAAAAGRGASGSFRTRQRRGLLRLNGPSAPSPSAHN